MSGIPQEMLEKMFKSMKRPRGTIQFRYSSKKLMDEKYPGGIIFQLSSGANVFRFERTKDLLLKFYYASPGAGTRVATIDLKKTSVCEKARICFTWSPEEINLYFRPQFKEGKLLSGRGENCKFQLCVGRDGAIYKIGDENLEMMNFHLFENGEEIVSETAIHSWENIKKALEILETGESDEGYIYESIMANFTISILVTGFEVYSKKRVMEMEQEGIEPDIKCFLNRREGKRFIELYEEEAKKMGISLLEYAVNKRRLVNFQNYEECRLAFNKIFQIKFGSVKVESDTLEDLKKFIGYRHRIVHVSPFMGMLNQPRAHLEEPVFSNKALAQKAIDIFDLFINKLHEATLEKR